MKEIYLVFTTDVLHTEELRELVAVCTSRDLAKGMCGMKGDDPQNINQTQGYKGKEVGGFLIKHIKEHEFNTFL